MTVQHPPDDEARTEAGGRPISFVSISRDDFESALVPVFGPTVAQEVAAQVRCITKLGTAAVDMTATAAEFSVRPLPLREWISRRDWTSP